MSERRGIGELIIYKAGGINTARDSIKVLAARGFLKSGGPATLLQTLTVYNYPGHPCCFRKNVGQRRKPLQNDADKRNLLRSGTGVVCSPEPPPLLAASQARRRNLSADID